MGRTAKRIAGGLLAGLGEGMLESARAKREEAMLRLREENQSSREKSRDDRATARDATQFNNRKGLLSSVVPDEAGNLIGITQGGETKNLDIKSGRKKDQNNTGLSVDDKREIDIAIKPNTSGKGSFEGETTDWEGVAASLIAAGRPDLAQRVLPQTGGNSKTDVESSEYRESARLAEKWASDQAGYFSRDKTDFEGYGGNRAEAIQKKTLEIYNEMKGGTAPASTGSAQTGAPQDRTSAPPEQAGAPTGSGTEADPYQASSQADINWFKDSARPGTIIEVDGKLYVK